MHTYKEDATQTFLPYASFTDSARVLDRLRLGKQRVEAYQILRTLLGFSDGWSNHPAVKMWRGSERRLSFYTLAMCCEWVNRGYNDSVQEKVFSLYNEANKKGVVLGERIPSFLLDPEECAKLTASHRSNLLRKDPAFYGQYGWQEPDNLPYYWPKGGG